LQFSNTVKDQNYKRNLLLTYRCKD